MSSHSHTLLSAVVAESKSKKTLAWAGLLLFSALTLVLLRVPLFRILGFEFALALALIGSIIAASVGSSMVWRARQLPYEHRQQLTSPGSTFVTLWLWTSLLSGLLLFIAVAVVVVNGIWVRNCDWIFGAQCLVLMPLASVVLASGLGVLCGFCAGSRRWLHILLPPLIIFATVLGSVIHFYFSPSIFSYNAWIGYFPGNLYDENIVLSAPIYWARLFQLSLLTFAATLASIFLNVPELKLQLTPHVGPKRIRTLLLLAVSGIATATLCYNSGSLGFSVSTRNIVAALPGVYESEHFTIRYPANQNIADNIEVIAEEHEFRRAQLVRELGIDPADKITSYYFSNKQQKHEWIGARNVHLAKPWRQEIYLLHSSFPHQIIRHEIAHVLAGSFGDSIFNVSAKTVAEIPLSISWGLIEGVAVATDWPGHSGKSLTPHQNVKAMQQLGNTPPIQRLLYNGFFAYSAPRSYTISGSFVRFLLDRYGSEPLRTLYSTGGDFMASYGLSLTALSTQWDQVIADTTVPDDADQIIKERFRKKAIFHRPCPHFVARAKGQIEKKLATGDTDAALEISQQICANAPNEPNHQLRLASVLVTSGKPEKARQILETLSQDAENVTPEVRAHALLRLTYIYYAMADSDHVHTLLETMMKLPLPANLVRQARVMDEVLQHQGPAGNALREIFWNEDLSSRVNPTVVAALAAEAIGAEPDLALAHYLLARQLNGLGNPNATRRALVRSLDNSEQGTPLDPLVKREAAQLLAKAGYLAGAYNDVARACAILVEANQPETTRLLGYDWLERIHWKRHGSVPQGRLGWRDERTQSGPVQTKSLEK